MPTKQKRLSIPVTPEVEAAFARFASVTGVSVSKAMGDWLADTLDGVEAMTRVIESAKGNTQQATSNMMLFAEGLLAHGEAVLGGLVEVAKQEKEATQEALKARDGAIYPPLSNTGGKSPSEGRSREGGR